MCNECSGIKACHVDANSGLRCSNEKLRQHRIQPSSKYVYRVLDGDGVWVKGWVLDGDWDWVKGWVLDGDWVKGWVLDGDWDWVKGWVLDGDLGLG